MHNLPKQTQNGSASQKTLFFSPYGLFSPHIMREMILIQRLQKRGHEIFNVACDKTFSICDYKTECSKCFNISKTHLSESSFPSLWLSQYTKEEDKKHALAWIAGIQPDQYPHATFNGLNLGEWVRSSVHFMLKISKLDFSDSLTLKTFRDFLISGYVFACSAQRLLDERKYDRVVMVNGRFFSHRILMEMAKNRNIPVVTHEYGHYFQTVQLQFDRISNSYSNLIDDWREDNRIPLNLQALSHVHQIVLDKRFRRRSPFQFYTPLPTKTEKDKTMTKKKVLCLLSSEYEFNASPDYQLIVGTQTDWIKLLAVEMEKYENHHFIIKLHPNSEKSIVSDMKRIFSDSNIKGSYEILWPETSKSTYDLIDETDYVLVFWSTAGMEAACASKKIFCVTHCVYYGAPFLQSLSSKENHSQELRSFLLDLNPTQNIQQEAYRFSYRYFVEQSIPFTGISNPQGSVSIYNQPVEFYAATKSLLHDPYIDYLTECIENSKFPDTKHINGEFHDLQGVQEKFFFKCLSLIQDFGDISFPKKKILVLRNKKTNSRQHCFENQMRISLFEESNASDWITFFLLLDGHQVYAIDPEDKFLLEQWAHEYGLFSGSHYLKGLLHSPLLFKFVSETLFRSPFLTKIGRKFLFLLGKFQKQSTPDSLLQRFIAWFEPNYIFKDEAETSLLLGKHFQSFAFTNENLERLMNDTNFETNFKNIFTAMRSQMR